MTRAIICLLVGISIIGATSGYTAKRRPAPLWVGLPLLAAIALMIGGSASFASMVASALAGRRSTVAYFLVDLGLFAMTIWAATIAVQIVQNVIYRIVGAPVQRIRWWRGESRSRRKRDIADNPS